jgi:hypothetical protein
MRAMLLSRAPVNTAWIARTRELLFPLVEHGPAGVDLSGPERLLIPHTFKPRLSFSDALVAVTAAFLRIFLGSLLFAVWGTYSLAAWSGTQSYLLRAAVLVPMFVVFVLSFGLLLLAIASFVRACSPKRL